MMAKQLLFNQSGGGATGGKFQKIATGQTTASTRTTTIYFDDSPYTDIVFQTGATLPDETDYFASGGGQLIMLILNDTYKDFTSGVTYYFAGNSGSASQITVTITKIDGGIRINQSANGLRYYNVYAR